MATPFSLVIITRNAAALLPTCLASASFADEIIVVDSGSTDDTVTIARAHGARIIEQAWLGFGRQKQFAVTQARNDWVLCLDADERVSGELKQSIQTALAAPQHHAYEMPRRNRFMGRWLHHGEGYPDLNLRLFDRRYAQWSDDAVHEHVLTRAAVGKLTGDLLHESQVNLREYLEKQNRYTSLQAERLYARGRRGSIAKLILSPILRFLKFYFLRLGFLDGVPGLVHILIGCQNSFMKNAKLLELDRGHPASTAVREKRRE